MATCSHVNMADDWEKCQRCQRETDVYVWTDRYVRYVVGNIRENDSQRNCNKIINKVR